MSHEAELFAETLKAARESKGLSQRALGEKAGVPQAHISNIEKGTVDLRLSSLVALARVLDLELTLVPRKILPAVQSIVRSSSQASVSASASGDALKALQRLQKDIDSMQSAVGFPQELAQMARQVRELRNFGLVPSQVEILKKISKTVQAFKEHSNGIEELRQALVRIQRLRSELALSTASLPEIVPVRPAYSLDDNEDGYA
jgi:transcriptional regulator with XRE-family HTH domain